METDAWGTPGAVVIHRAEAGGGDPSDAQTNPHHPAATATTATRTSHYVYELFEALNEQPKSHVQHREEGELHVFHYNQKVQNTCAWTPELLLARGLIFRRNARTKETTLVATPWPKFFNLQEDGYELEELAAVTVPAAAPPPAEAQRPRRGSVLELQSGAAPYILSRRSPVRPARPLPRPRAARPRAS